MVDKVSYRDWRLSIKGSIGDQGYRYTVAGFLGEQRMMIGW